jgi:hypothetical protein
LKKINIHPVDMKNPIRNFFNGGVRNGDRHRKRPAAEAAGLVGENWWTFYP